MGGRFFVRGGFGGVDGATPNHGEPRARWRIMQTMTRFPALIL